jgi:hypothetical protein
MPPMLVVGGALKLPRGDPAVDYLWGRDGDPEEYGKCMGREPAGFRWFAWAITRGVAALLVVAWVAGCGASGPVPSEPVQNYLSDLGEGNYGGACAQLDGRARASLLGLQRSRSSCAKVFTRCLPNSASAPKKDQSQLLYATVEVNQNGPKADAVVSGTAVARAVKEVTLANESGTWKLTSYGRGLTGCHEKGRHRRS